MRAALPARDAVCLLCLAARRRRRAARILRRLGHEANDALDEFLELALAYERKAPASLQGFMAWLRAADTEVKRDMEISRNEVRVMTVHGAKGLEASVVFLADTTTSPQDTQRLRLIHLPDGNGGKVVVWAGRKAEDTAGVAKARTAMLDETEHEYRRLLYVAMTRAADRLIVAGCRPGNRNNVRQDSWYDLINKGLENSGLQVEEIADGDGTVKRYTRPEDAAPSRCGRRRRRQPRRSTLPAWLHTPAAPEQIIDRRLRPSDPAAEDSHPSAPANRSSCAPAPCSAARWCTGCCNRCPISRPRAAARRRCVISPATPATGPRPTATTLAEHMLALIADPRFAPVFAPGSRAEVSIAGRLERPGQPPALVSGQIDRLVVTPSRGPDRRLQDQPRPADAAAEAPAGYVRQLALYRAVLQNFIPSCRSGQRCFGPKRLN